MRSFNTVEELKEALVAEGCEGAVVFVDSDYLEAVVGYDEEGRVVYHYDLMIQCLVDEGMDEEEAIEWISYNTIRALPYMGDKAPLIIHEFLE